MGVWNERKHLIDENGNFDLIKVKKHMAQWRERNVGSR